MQYFESLLQEVKEEQEKEISKAVEKAEALKLQKLQAKLDRCVKDKKFLDDVSVDIYDVVSCWVHVENSTVQFCLGFCKT